VECVCPACSDADGTAEIFLGKDREDGQFASMSREPEVVRNLSDRSIKVTTRSLPSLLAEYGIPDDFGVLLLDTEGLDLTIL
jgi:FkbM family methyltransferase